MGLPSYIVNIDEFNEILSQSLTDEDARLDYYYYLDFSTLKFDCWHTDISIRKEFQHEQDIIIYGFEIQETAFELGNNIKISLLSSDNEYNEIENFYIYDGFDCIILNPPIVLKANEKVLIDYYNNNAMKKQVSFLIKYLLRK